MRDELTAANRTESKGHAMKTSSGSALFGLDKKSVAKLGGRLSGEFAESISLIEAAIYSKAGNQTRRGQSRATQAPNTALTCPAGFRSVDLLIPDAKIRLRPAADNPRATRGLAVPEKRYQ